MGRVRSDPLKNAQFREASRQRLACLREGKCSKASEALHAFTRLLVKVPEHTWGVSQIWFLPDYVNYTNAQFDLARAQQRLGFVADNRKHADYNTTGTVPLVDPWAVRHPACHCHLCGRAQ